ncbi:unnamed protein product [Clonostachys chloroleuca]|uniref:Uncharacterized protein n=1 Tax=Clonostachys chloroleuca TaxID=1926264 RepID=A0AA35LRU4_9HYPO|nr:unnamed protein product [Clonostachys chloroleuca]
MLNITHKLNSTRTDNEILKSPRDSFHSNLPAVISNDTAHHVPLASISPGVGAYRAVIPNALPALSSNKNKYKVMNITVGRPSFWTLDKNYPWPHSLSTYGDWGNDDVLTTAFSQFHLLYSNPMAQSPNCSRAFEIFLQFCVKTYNATTDNTQGKATLLDKVNRGGFPPSGGHIDASYSLATIESPQMSFNITSTDALSYLEDIVLELSGSSVISGNTTRDDWNQSIPLGKEYATIDGTLDRMQGSPSMLAKQVFSKLYSGVWVSNSSADESKYETSEQYIDEATEGNIQKLFGNVASAMTS